MTRASFHELDQDLNRMVLRALPHGLYTCIVAVTLRTISLVYDSSWWTTTYFIREIIGGICTVLTLWDRRCDNGHTTFSGFNNSTRDISRTAHFAAYINWLLIYALLTLSAMLTCALLTIYRIIRNTLRVWMHTRDQSTNTGLTEYMSDGVRSQLPCLSRSLWVYVRKPSNVILRHIRVMA
ncbi:hypothetical protein ARMGADRAFT_1142871 [Armillaria gallica]|uniref:Uncharacterized protein n=1 Tax=Armillaria gallica TaxID=47427 RepID=A0A2H3DLR4_ARMGA|nr:hypothetical protein ARMGADRAFT_1142871 [Armillaria gallica]